MRSILCLGVAAALCAAAPTHAGWFSRKAPQPAEAAVAYDEAAIDGLLYPAPDYDSAAIGALLSAADERLESGPKPVWRIGVRRAALTLREPLADDAWPLVSGFGPSDADPEADGLSAVIGGHIFDFTPQTAFEVNRRGRRASAGGLARLGLTNVRDGRELGNRGRWYLYGAASSQAVGWNFTGAPDEPLQAVGLTRDRVSGAIAEAQAGIAWRKGAVQASFGYTRRRIRLKGDLADLADKLDLDIFPRSSDAVTFSYSFTPK